MKLARKKKPFKHRMGRRAVEKTVQEARKRFPRLKKPDDVFDFVREMKVKYPLPYHSKSTGGSWNPGEFIISWLVKMDEKELRGRCLYHGLSDKGTRFEQIQRMYLHWRSSKLKLGFPLIAYSAGCEKYGPNQCDCGILKADSTRIKRYPRLHPRFPRLDIKRFPRLNNSSRHDPSVSSWWKSFRKYYKEKTGIKLGMFDLLFYAA